MKYLLNKWGWRSLLFNSKSCHGERGVRGWKSSPNWRSLNKQIAVAIHRGEGLVEVWRVELREGNVEIHITFGLRIGIL